MVVVAKTRKGNYHEETGRDNEDSYLINKENGFVVLADGIGGSSRGKEASEKAVKDMDNFVSQYLNSTSIEESKILEEAFKATHESIYWWDVYRRIENMARNIVKNIDDKIFKFPYEVSGKILNTKQEFLEFIGELKDLEHKIKEREKGYYENKENEKYVITKEDVRRIDMEFSITESIMLDHKIISSKEATHVAGCPATAILEFDKDIYVSHIGDTKLYVKEKKKPLKQIAEQPRFKAFLCDFLGTREKFNPQKIVLKKKNIEYMLMATDGFKLDEVEIQRKFSDYKEDLSKEPEKTLEELLDVLIWKSKKHDDDITLIALYNQHSSLTEKIYKKAESLTDKIKRSTDNLVSSSYNKIIKPISNLYASYRWKSKKALRSININLKKSLAIAGATLGAVALASLIWYASTRPKPVEIPKVSKVVKVEEQKQYINEERKIIEGEKEIEKKKETIIESFTDQKLPEKIVNYETKATIMEPKVKLSKNRLYAVIPVKGEADALEMKIGDRSFVSKEKYGNNFIFDARIDDKVYEDIKGEQKYSIIASDIHGSTRTQTASAKGKVIPVLEEDSKIAEELSIKDYITPKPAYNSVINSLKPAEPVTKTEIIQEKENYSIIGKADIKIDKETKTLDAKIPVYKDNINNACISISVNAGDYKGWWTACSVPGEYTNNVSVSAKMPDPIFNYVSANNNITYQVTANEVKEGKRTQRASYNYYVSTK